MADRDRAWLGGGAPTARSRRRRPARRHRRGRPAALRRPGGGYVAALLRRAHLRRRRAVVRHGRRRARRAAPATLRRVLAAGRGAGRRRHRRPAGARRGGGAPVAARCCGAPSTLRRRRPSQLDPVRAVDVLTSPVGGARRRALRRLRRLAAAPTSSTTAAGAPATCCSPRLLLTPRPARHRLGAPRRHRARRSPRCSRPAVDGRCATARASRSCSGGCGAPAGWPARGGDAALGRGPARRPRRPRPRRRARPVRRRRALRRPAAAAPPPRLPRPRPGQDVAGDTLVARAPAGESVALLTPAAAAGREWDLVVVAGVQEGVWPDLRLRGSLLGSTDLVDLRRPAGRLDPRAARRAVRHDETRLFHVAVTRARRAARRHRGAQRGRAALALPRRRRPAADDALADARFTDVAAAADAARASSPSCGARSPAPTRRAPRPAVTALAALAARGRSGRRPGAVVGAARRHRRPPAAPTRRAGARLAVEGRPLRPLRAALVPQRRRRRGRVAGRRSRRHPRPRRSPPSCRDATPPTLTPPSSTRAGAGSGSTPGWVSRRDLGRRTTWSPGSPATVARAPTRLGGAGRHRGATSGSTLGRRRRGRPGRPHRARRRGPAAHRRPQDRQVASPPRTSCAEHGQLGAYQLAVEEGAFAEHGDRVRRRRPAAARPGRGGQAAALQPQPPLALDDDPTWARDARRGGRRRDGRRRSSRPRPATQCGTCQVQDSCPAQRRGEAAVTATTRHPDAAAPRRRRCAGRGRARPALGQAARPTPEQAAVIEAPLRPLLVVAGRRLGQDRDDGRARGLARRQRPRRPRRGARPHLHPQGRRRAVRAHPAPAGALREAGLWTRAATTARRRGARRRAHRLDLPRVCRPARARARPAARASSRSPAAHRGRGLAARRRGGGALGRPDGRRRQGRVHRHPGRHRRSPARWPSTSSASTTSPAPRRRRGRARARCPTRGHGGAPARPSPRRRRRAARAARGAADRRALPRAQARARRLDFADQMAARRPAGHAGRRRSARSSASGSGPCCSTSSRTPRRPSSSCCGRCSSPRAVAVTAVGDPHQSIYGWRGASATTLQPVPRELRRRRGRRRRCCPLSTSWRNDAGDARRRQRRGRAARGRARVPVDALRAAAPGPAAGEVAGGRGSRRPSDEAALRRRRGSARRGAPAGAGRRQRCCAASGPSSPPVIEALRARAASPTRSSASAACCSPPRSTTSSRSPRRAATPPAATS